MISKDEARTLLEPYHIPLRACVMAAWQQWRTVILPVVPIAYPRGQANIMYELIAQEARRQFLPLSGVQIIEGSVRLFLAIGDRILIRFKKLNDRLRPSNYPTCQALLFDEQMDLPTIPSKAERITVGYKLNELRTDISVHAVYVQGKDVVWDYQLEQPQTAVLPLTPQGTPLGADQPQVQLKQSTAPDKAIGKK